MTADPEIEFRRMKARMAWVAIAMAVAFPTAMYFVPPVKDIASLYFDFMKTLVLGFLNP
jgi:hypothetical protein